MLSVPLVLLALVVSPNARAQAASDTEVAALTRRIEELEARLQQGATGSPEELEALRERLRALESQIDTLNSAESARVEQEQEIPLDLETKVNGYGSVGLDQHDFSGAPQFQLGELSLVYSANLDRKVTFQADLVHTQALTEATLDIAALEVGVHFAPGANLKVGRSFFPLSYWATESLHGAYRYTPVSPPSFLRLNQAELEWFPLRQVGVQLEGKADVGLWQVGYVTGVSNGRSPVVGQAEHVESPSWERAVLAGVSLHSPSGIDMGVGAYYDSVPLSELSGEQVEEDAHAESEATDDHSDEEGSEDEEIRVDEIVGAAYFVVHGGRLRIQSEVFGVMHLDEGASGMHLLSYVEASYRIKQVAPYVIGELTLADEFDPLFQLAGFTSEPVAEAGAGLRWDAGIHVAAKFQASVERHLATGSSAGGDWIPSLHAQVAAGF